MSMQITRENAPFRSALWSLGAVLAGFVSIAVLSTTADMLFHAIGVFPPDGTPSYETAPSSWPSAIAPSSASLPATSPPGSRRTTPWATPWRSASLASS
ncbi:hypothetical protein [Paradevosia shaoguanensis]|uniref:hypothetical protein n=1 Tax=Paradevosia shaoguanensis TaxID=1335043 RepID=UPI0019337AF5|nr:hypothetical protein [Paradevosia shaoguanensis]